jgi:superfamily I DNA/RNA helicase
MARENGFSLRRPANEQEYNDVILPEDLLDAAEKLGPQYDAIIVDEGQDFKDIYWIALGALLEPNGIFYVFYDDNQNLYDGIDALKGIIDEEPFVLSENCRNTKSIHSVVAKFHSRPEELVCKAPIGHLPELIYYSDGTNLNRLVQSKLHHLVIDGNVSPKDIVILTPRGQDRTLFKIGSHLGNFILTDGNRKWENSIQVSTVHSFKGLERRVVILVEVDDSIRYKPETIMYVGCSRARTYLILLADEKLSSDIKHRIESACKG